MKKQILFGILLFFSLSAKCIAQRKDVSKIESAPAQLVWLTNWLKAWELVSKDIFKLPLTTAPDMIFFDEANVYSNYRLIELESKPVPGPSYFGKKMNWWVTKHTGEINLPDGQKIPAQIIAFAAPGKGKNRKNYFVMAAPPIWGKAGVTSKELGFDKLLTAVFIHEFAHTRQMGGLVKLLDSLELAVKTNMEFDDDIIQNTFGKDSNYVKDYKEEVGLFYKAALAKSKDSVVSYSSKAFQLMAARQQKYFNGEKEVYKTLDAVFLTMEGVGQFAGFSWLTHPKGGNISFAQALQGFRRNGKKWSQDEGLALFIVLRKLYVPDWNNTVFGNKLKYITELLAEGLR